METISNNSKLEIIEIETMGVLSFIIYFLIFLSLFLLIYYLIHIGNKYIKENQRVYITKKYFYLFIFLYTLLFSLILIHTNKILIFNILMPFIISIILTYILNPIVNVIQNMGVTRFWSIVIVYIIICLIITISSFVFIPRLLEEIQELLELMPKYGGKIYDGSYEIYLTGEKFFDGLPKELIDMKGILKLQLYKVEKLIIELLSIISKFLLNILTKVMNFILIPILTFYLLNDLNKFKNFIKRIIPRHYKAGLLQLMTDIDIILSRFIRGQILLSVFIFFFTSIAMFILDVNFAIIIGLVAGITNIIPYLGPIAGTIPGVIFALIDGPVKALWVVIVFFIIQQIESTIIAPKIIGDSVGVHPLLIILSLFIGGNLFGLCGLLFAVPGVAITKILMQYFLNSFIRS